MVEGRGLGEEVAGGGREEVCGGRSHGAPKGLEPLALASPAGLEPVPARIWGRAQGVEVPMLYTEISALRLPGHLGWAWWQLCALPHRAHAVLFRNRTHAVR